MQEHDQVPLPDWQELPPDEMQRRAEAFRAAIARRHTVRSFADRPVPRALIETCLAAAGRAPSGANNQPWFFSVIGDPALKRRVRAAAEAEERSFYAGRAGDEWLAALRPLGTDADKPFLESAPWLIAIFAQRRGGATPDEARKNYYVSESVGIATGFLIAALHAAGLATLTHTPNPMGFLNRLCGRPETEKPFLLLVVGYPAAGTTVPAAALVKKPLAEISAFL